MDSHDSQLKARSFRFTLNLSSFCCVCRYYCLVLYLVAPMFSVINGYCAGRSLSMLPAMMQLHPC